jgi:ferredoxin-NADP reductase
VRDSANDAVYLRELQSLADLGLNLQVFETRVASEIAENDSGASASGATFASTMKANVGVTRGRRMEASDLVKQSHLKDDAAQYYVCGPAEFAEATEKMLVDELKVDPERVHWEKWW